MGMIIFYRNADININWPNVVLLPKPLFFALYTVKSTDLVFFSSNLTW